MATIYCFSSTGNSLFVAKKIAETINAEVISMTTAATLCRDTVVGFVFPTYFWGLPKTAEQFIKNLSFSEKSPYLFAITTYGGLVFGLSHVVNELLKPKNLSLSYFAKIRSVENYIVSPFFTANDSPALHEKVNRKTVHIAGEIAKRLKKKRDIYFFINRIVWRFYPANRKKTFDCNFTSEGCTGCGICEKVCPRGNIHVTNGKPCFSGNCELCLACFHACPQTAINYQHSKGKKRYRNPQISLQELICFQHPDTTP